MLPLPHLPPLGQPVELPPQILSVARSIDSLTELEQMGGVTDSEPHAHLMGASVLLVGLLAFVGQQRAGAYGALSGALSAGSAINGMRAYHYAKLHGDEAKKEAIISGTYMLLSAGAAFYVYSRRPDEKKEGK